MANDDPSQVGETVFQLVQGNPRIYQYALRLLNRFFHSLFNLLGVIIKFYYSHLMPGAEVEKIIPLIKKHCKSISRTHTHTHISIILQLRQ